MRERGLVPYRGRVLCRLVLSLALLAALAAVAPDQEVGTTTAAPTSTTSTTSADNPLAGRAWGVYRGAAELVWEPYERATGQRKTLLAKIALQPKSKWFGDWISDDTIADKVRDYVATATGGDPEVLVPMTVFRVMPWEQEACTRLPTRAEKASYRRWINRFASALGETHTLMVLQPDGPFARCAPRGSKVPSQLVAWAARTFAALPNTHVYLDAGAADWLHVDDAVQLLVDLGVEHVRGFALNTTHYDATSSQVSYGAEVVAGLAARGLPGKHFVVDTTQNGRPFTHAQWAADPRGRPFDDAATCRTPAGLRCVTLGIPPTADVGSPAWGLPARVRALAAEHVDGFVWTGRPWLHQQSHPFDLARALAVARTTPYQ
ncbi:glucanase [Nocardioides psychrotolerans]|uniref:Glucanase n=1 Tax=Nocardioides psychrotolerans TaxID=1005945 RepID=A0A1I3J6M4_9ACTN|nr:glucanase [Nocardioides psychrotolerans]SFI55833.1 endoglucanase [Nocardioides psychrotolerans]